MRVCTLYTGCIVVKSEHSTSQRLIYARIVFKKHTFVRTYIYSEWIELDMRIRAVHFSVCVGCTVIVYKCAAAFTNTRLSIATSSDCVRISVWDFSVFGFEKDTRFVITK